MHATHTQMLLRRYILKTVHFQIHWLRKITLSPQACNFSLYIFQMYKLQDDKRLTDMICPTLKVIKKFIQSWPQSEFSENEWYFHHFITFFFFFPHLAGKPSVNYGYLARATVDKLYMFFLRQSCWPSEMLGIRNAFAISLIACGYFSCRHTEVYTLRPVGK